MPVGHIVLVPLSTDKVVPRAVRFARGEDTQPPEPPVIVRLPGLPPRPVGEQKD